MSEEELPSTSAQARAAATQTSNGSQRISAWNAESEGQLNSLLLSIIKCSFCGKLPMGHVFQCRNGHIFCSSCMYYLASNRGPNNRPLGACSVCQVDIAGDAAFRNLSIENTIRELQIECDYCGAIISTTQFKKHQTTNCPKRPTVCKYARFSCEWKGRFDLLADHEGSCGFALKSGRELVQSLLKKHEELQEFNEVKNGLHDFMQCGHFTSADFSLSKHLFDPEKAELHFAGGCVLAFSKIWFIKAAIIDQDTSDGEKKQALVHQLQLQSQTNQPMAIKYYLQLRGRFFSESYTRMRIHHHVFDEANKLGKKGKIENIQDRESPDMLIPLDKVTEIPIRLYICLVGGDVEF